MGWKPVPNSFSLETPSLSTEETLRTACHTHTLREERESMWGLSTVSAEKVRKQEKDSGAVSNTEIAAQAQYSLHLQFS